MGVAPSGAIFIRGPPVRMPVIRFVVKRFPVQAQVWTPANPQTGLRREVSLKMNAACQIETGPAQVRRTRRPCL
jgi:hypothetical protein